MSADGNKVLTGATVAKLDDNQRRVTIPETSVFARASPEQKIDIEIAMGKKGSNVTREAADMALLNDNLTTIVAAVRQGRRIYDNI